MAFIVVGSYDACTLSNTYSLPGGNRLQGVVWLSIGR